MLDIIKKSIVPCSPLFTLVQFPAKLKRAIFLVSGLLFLRTRLLFPWKRIGDRVSQC